MTDSTPTTGTPVVTTGTVQAAPAAPANDSSVGGGTVLLIVVAVVALGYAVLKFLNTDEAPVDPVEEPTDSNTTTTDGTDSSTHA